MVLMYVGSMQVLLDEGYNRPGLDALCQDLNIERKSHSAFEDSKILKTVCTMKSGMLEHPYGYGRVFSSAPNSVS